MNSSLSSRNVSGIKGVNFNKRAKQWHARIKIDGIRIHIGYYDNIEAAKEARIKKANEVFGIYTRILTTNTGLLHDDHTDLNTSILNDSHIYDVVV